MAFNSKGYEYQYYKFEGKLCRIDMMNPTNVEVFKDNKWVYDEDISFKRFKVISGSNEYKFVRISEEKAKEIFEGKNM